MAKNTTRLKTLAPAYPVPQTQDEAADFMARIGLAQRERARIEAAMNDELAAVKARFEAEAQPHNEVILNCTRGLQNWCDANRDRLTSNGKVKFARFATGEVSWRQRPPKVGVRGVDTILEALKRLSLTRFIRVKEEINRDAMLAEPEVAMTVPGVTIGSAGEDFVVKPFETELEEVAA